MWEIRVRHMLFDAERVQELIKRITPSYFVRSFQAATSISTGNFEMVRNMISTFDLEIPRQAITYHLFMAYLLKDSTSAQIKELVKAIEIGSKHGYFHHFLTQRSDIMQHYISIASAIPTAFNERLARAAGEELNKMMIAKNDAGEALTRREADILRHLATGLPLKDIAANLNISKNTIKTHLRNLYKKLGAEDRKDAVEKGKKLLKV
jgi:DNA-binding NarL/FixJ family response regulator